MCKDNNMERFDFSRELDRVQAEQDYYEEEKTSSVLRHKDEGYNRGELHGGAILTENDVRDIRKLLVTMSHRSIAKQYGMSRQAIDNIASRKHWKHVK